MSTRVARWLAWSLVALAVALGLSFLPLGIAVSRAAAAPGTRVPAGAIAGLDLSGDSWLSWLKALPLLGETWGFAALGAVLVSRRSAPALGWLFCALGVELTMEFFTDFYALYALFVAPGSVPGGLAAAWVQHWIWFVGIMLLVALVPLRFPTGRLVSARWRPAWWLAVGMTAAGVLLQAFAPGPLGNILYGAHVLNPLGVAGLATPIAVIIPVLTPVLLASILLAVASLGVRLRRARGVERQQIKWFAYCAVLLALAFVGQTVAQVAQNVLGISSPFVDLAASLGLDIGLTGLPVVTGLSILRYRLFDIDVLIRLTLVYGTLTALLAGVYVGVVIGAQAVVQALTGQREQPPLVIVASTLLVAALVTPLRRGIQAAIDRRFYRRKYDAERTLAAFGATLRNEVELERVRELLLAVVEETMQPAHASLWLRRPPDHEVKR